MFSTVATKLGHDQDQPFCKQISHLRFQTKISCQQKSYDPDVAHICWQQISSALKGKIKGKRKYNKGNIGKQELMKQ